MLKNIYVKSIGVWIIFAVLTVFFGALRELVFIPFTGLGPNLARALLLPVAFFYIIGLTYYFFKRTDASYSKSDIIRIGILWLVLTVIYEFVFGAIIMGNPIEKLIADYNIIEGRTWSLFLLCILLAPTIVHKFFLKK